MGSFLRQIIYIFTYLTVIQVCLGSSNSAEKVTLDLYYESLCPFCANFIINELPVIFENGMIDIVNLRLFPWGNARLTSNNSFICQHGPNECLFNSIEACAIDAWPKLANHFSFINCVENLLYEGKSSQWETCFNKLGLDPNPVTGCYKGEDGKKLVLKYAALTSALEPPHEYVPWVVVNGEPLYDDYENFVSYICKAYKGSPPNICSKASFISVPRKKIKQIHHLVLKYAALTSTLEPPHKFVPWVVVNGEPLYDNDVNFISYICKAYKVPPSDVCNKTSFASVPKMKIRQVHHVDYIEHTTHVPVLMKIWSIIASWVDQIM